MRSFCLSADQIEACWEDFEHFFVTFENGGADMSAREAKAKAQSAQLQVWGLQDDQAVRGIVTTEVIRTARGLICTITMAQGKAADEPKHNLLESIVQWAKEMGCVCVRVQGRPGWLRWDRRFKPTGVIAEIAL